MPTSNTNIDVGCGKREAQINNWSVVVVACKGSTRYSNYLENYWPCAGRLLAVVVVVVVSHIQRIGCQPEKTTLHGCQSRSWSAEQGKENKRKSLAAYPPPPPPTVNAIGTQLRDPINSGLTRWRMAYDTAAEIGRNFVTRQSTR